MRHFTGTLKLYVNVRRDGFRVRSDKICASDGTYLFNQTDNVPLSLLIYWTPLNSNGAHSKTDGATVLN